MPVCYTLNSELSIREIDDEVFILDRSTNTLHSFNGTGAFVWRRLQAHEDLTAISTALADEYEVAPEQAAEDVFDFLLSLEKAKLATVSRA